MVDETYGDYVKMSLATEWQSQARKEGYKQGLLTALGIAKEYSATAIGHVIVRKIEEQLE